MKYLFLSLAIEIVLIDDSTADNVLPDSYDLLDHSIDNTEKILTVPGFHRDKRTSLAASRQKRIARYRYDRHHGGTDSISCTNSEQRETVAWYSQTKTDRSSSCKSILNIV